MTIDELVDVLAERYAIKKRQLDEFLRELRRRQDEMASLIHELDAAKKCQQLEWRENAKRRAAEEDGVKDESSF
jgi:hypothetical protein